jgi:Tfp pilus assembly protein PilF
VLHLPGRNLSARSALILIISVTVLVFWPVVTFDFTTWDDGETVARNPKLNPPTVDSLKSFWTSPQMDLYVPATYTLWAITANAAQRPQATPQTPPLNPAVFHGLNLAVHLAAACVAYLLLRDLVGRSLPALLGALLFALHPMQVEPVAWISGTKDLLFGLFSLLAVSQYVGLARDDVAEAHVPAGEWYGRYLLALLCFVLAMLSKPTAVIVPFVVIAIDRLMIGRSWTRVLSWTWPWVVLALPCAIVAKLSQPAAHAASWATPLWTRPLIAADALAFYLYKLVFPLVLTFDYGRTPQRVLTSGWLYWTWIIPAVLAVIALRVRRSAPAAATAGGIMIIVLLPVLGLTPFDFQAYSTVADHYLYFAMIGPALLAAWLVARFGRNAAVIVAAVVLLFAVRSFAQVGHWRDSGALFNHTLGINPSSFTSYNHLAAAAADEGRVDDAIELSRRAIALNPNFAAAHLVHADALRMRGDIRTAMAEYREALRQLPDFAPALINLAALLAEQGQLAEAIPLARRSVQAEPGSVRARLNLGRMYLQVGQTDAARREFEAAVRLAPDDSTARELLSAASSASPAPLALP